MTWWVRERGRGRALFLALHFSGALVTPSPFSACVLAGRKMGSQQGWEKYPASQGCSASESSVHVPEEETEALQGQLLPRFCWGDSETQVPLYVFSWYFPHHHSTGPHPSEQLAHGGLVKNRAEALHAWALGSMQKKKK